MTALSNTLVMHRLRIIGAVGAIVVVFVTVVAVRVMSIAPDSQVPGVTTHAATTNAAIQHDTSGRLTAFDGPDSTAERESRRLSLSPGPNEGEADVREQAAVGSPARAVPAGSAEVEQTTFGTRAPATLVASFDGLGVGFVGPQGTANLRNPSDNTLAVGPDHSVQIVNTRMAIFTKKGKQFDTTGRVLYGPGETRNVFKGFGSGCEARNNGDAVARYDQLADRWLIVMPIFSRLPVRPDDPAAPKPGEPASESMQGRAGQPGEATRLYEPPPPPPESANAVRQRPPGVRPPRDSGLYAMCYALSVGPDPFGPYYRYEFVRPLFPDYPRPAVWPDGYYVPTSTGDDVIEKHACVVDRARMLKGEAATEQCVIIADVNFLNNADLDGKELPPAGAPNIMMATGGTQLRKIMEDDGIYVWSFNVDWDDPSRTKVEGPTKIPVAPYRYLC